VRPNPGRQIQELVTASDTVTTLAMPMKRKFRISGSGVLQWYDLGDARYYPPNLELEFFNGSSEIVGVKNSDNTVWERVPPRWGITCVLVDNSTAAGVWQVFWRPNPMLKNGGFIPYDFTGFVSSHSYGPDGIVAVASGGTAASINISFASNRQGGIQQQISTNGQYVYHYNGRYDLLGSKAVSFKQAIKFTALATVAEDYIYRFGFSDNFAGGAPTNGVVFIYDRNTYGNVWVTRTISAAGGNTTNSTAISPKTGANWDVLLGEISSNAARADFWVNNVLQFSHTTAANIPTAASGGIMFGWTKTAGNGAEYNQSDTLEIGRYPVAQRAS
jgi:hypothetical protein